MFETLRRPSGKCRMHSVRGRHVDYRYRNAADVFQNSSGLYFFIISELYRVLSEYIEGQTAKVLTDITRIILKRIRLYTGKKQLWRNADF